MQELPTKATDAFQKAREHLAKVQNFAYAPRARSVIRDPQYTKRADSPTLDSIKQRNRELIRATSPFSTSMTVMRSKSVTALQPKVDVGRGPFARHPSVVQGRVSGNTFVSSVAPGSATSCAAPTNPWHQLLVPSANDPASTAKPFTPILGKRAALAERAWLLRQQTSGTQSVFFPSSRPPPPVVARISATVLQQNPRGNQQSPAGFAFQQCRSVGVPQQGVNTFSKPVMAGTYQQQNVPDLTKDTAASSGDETKQGDDLEEVQRMLLRQQSGPVGILMTPQYQ
ncbi:unnamed protein product [Amoebophrya sp. A120]|nr:unnamed protein product [Amoebophrya sp. A120]|eukprot:GSA120T00018121001.1